MIESWRTFARERGFRFVADREPMLTGRHEGIEIEAHTHRGLAGGWITHVEATPRLALHGSVAVTPARGLRRLLATGPHRDLAVASSSESVARAVLDERVLLTLRALGPRLVELSYTPQRIELAWRDLDRSTATLEDVIACVAYLAAALAQTPYR